MVECYVYNNVSFKIGVFVNKCFNSILFALIGLKKSNETL